VTLNPRLDTLPIEESSIPATSVVIVGAGPYGLSLAAHLAAAGIDFQIFGKPMAAWRDMMPAGMLLKSEGFASSLYEPQGSFTLRTFCQLRGIPYKDRGLPIPLDTFISYGLSFQQQFVPCLVERQVVGIERTSHGEFLVQISEGELIRARKVVVAVGISHFQYVPSVLAALPQRYLSHSSAHNDLSQFRDRDAIVIGAGASALDSAALLHRAGARVQLVSRRPVIPFHRPPRSDLSLVDRLKNPATGIGPGWKNVLCTEMPRAFHLLPEKARLAIVHRHLGPAPGWFTREQTEGLFPFVLGATPVEASERNGRVELKLKMSDGSSRTLVADHVIAATGYKVDLRRLRFLSNELLADIDNVDHMPRLSQHFETSVAGLYFTGVAAASSFGPVLRFAFGAKFAAPYMARHLRRKVRLKTNPDPISAGAGEIKSSS